MNEVSESLTDNHCHVVTPCTNDRDCDIGNERALVDVYREFPPAISSNRI